MTEITIGADISKDHIDLHSLRVTNGRTGFAAILGWIGDAPVARIVYEPADAYRKAFERFMLTRGLPGSKFNPRQARRFAEALEGWPRQTAPMPRCWRNSDAADPRLFYPNAAFFAELKELHAARQALVKDRRLPLSV